MKCTAVLSQDVCLFVSLFVSAEAVLESCCLFEGLHVTVYVVSTRRFEYTALISYPHHAWAGCFESGAAEVRWFEFWAGVGVVQIRLIPACVPVRLCVCLQPPGRRIHGVGAVRGGASVLGQAVYKGGPVLLIGENEAPTHTHLQMSSYCMCVCVHRMRADQIVTR